MSTEPGPGAQEKPEPKNRRSPRRRLLPRLVLAVAVIAGLDIWMQLHAPLDLPAATTVDLELGRRYSQLLGELQDRGILDSARQRFYLWAYGRLHGDAARIRAGEYALTPGLTPLTLLDLLRSGKTVLHELRFVEGWRFGQAVAALRENGDIAHILGDAEGPALMAAIGRTGKDPEGRLFPDTYRFAKGTSDASLLKQAAAAMDRALEAEWQAREPDLPYATSTEALTMASLIEKETASAEERPRIAGVFVRRLRLGMRLQTDPTVIYGMGASYAGAIHSRDLLADTPYNTYLRDGLPPTPICLPGRDSLHAALHPAAGDALFFVSRGDGTHQFSATLDEHNAAVRRYQLGGGK